MLLLVSPPPPLETFVYGFWIYHGTRHWYRLR